MLRRLTGRHRTAAWNWQLASLLAFVAGLVDVSGFLALGQYTSHMSGLVASMAGDLHLRGVRAMGHPAMALVSFVAGAMTCALLVNWERRRNRESLWAVPVLLEAVLLASLALPFAPRHIWPALCLLSFSMGLQNAVITKISGNVIRTTHITGMVTDIGIELGKLFYWSRSRALAPVHADVRRLLRLMQLVALFFTGGAVGAFAYPAFHFGALLPVAAVLGAVTILPIATDLQPGQVLRPEHPL